METLLRIIDQKDEEIKDLKSKLRVRIIDNSNIHSMKFRGKDPRDMDKYELLRLNDFLFDKFKWFDDDIRPLILNDRL